MLSINKFGERIMKLFDLQNKCCLNQCFSHFDGDK